MGELERGLVIVLVGIGGVFANLFLIMMVVSVTGRILGKKKKPASAERAPKPASDKEQSDGNRAV